MASFQVISKSRFKLLSRNCIHLHNFIYKFYNSISTRWAGGRDDKYFARLRKNTISVYETETFSLIHKRSMKVDNVVDICWSPTDSILAFFVPELDDGNQLARVCLNAFLNLVVFRFSISLYLTCLISLLLCNSLAKWR